MKVEWLRPQRVLLAASAIAIGVLACRDTTTPKQSSAKEIAFEPSMTMGVGFVGVPQGRWSLGTFHSQSNLDAYNVELKSHDNTDIIISNITVAPNGHSGWHMHPGPVLVRVITGTITFYQGKDRTCSPQVHPAGSAFIEDGGTVGIARNESPTVEATVVAAFFIPAGTTVTRIDVPAPGNCPF